MVAALPTAAAELAEDTPPKKQNPTVKKTITKGSRQAPKSTQAVKNKYGTIALDRPKLKETIKRLKLKPADVDEKGESTVTDESATKKPKLAPKAPKAKAKSKGQYTFTKGTKGSKPKVEKVAKPRGRPPGSKNKKTIAMNSVPREAQIAQAVA
jgi:hypothetical protein